MTYMMKDFFETKGISDWFNYDKNCCKKLLVESIITIPKHISSISKIVQVTGDVEIESIKKSIKVNMNEEIMGLNGEKVYCNKFLISGKLVLKIKYNSYILEEILCTNNSSIEFKEIFTVYKKLTLDSFIIVMPYMEDLSVKLINSRQIVQSTQIIFDISSY